MLQHNQIVKIVDKVAKANLESQIVQSVTTEPATDSEGRDALRITIVIAPGSASTLSGDAVLNTLYQIQDLLRQQGEERFPIIEYATKDELEKGGDT